VREAKLTVWGRWGLRGGVGKGDGVVMYKKWGRMLFVKVLEGYPFLIFNFRLSFVLLVKPQFCVRADKLISDVGKRGGVDEKEV